MDEIVADGDPVVNQENDLATLVLAVDVTANPEAKTEMGFVSMSRILLLVSLMCTVNAASPVAAAVGSMRIAAPLGAARISHAGFRKVTEIQTCVLTLDVAFHLFDENNFFLFKEPEICPATAAGRLDVGLLQPSIWEAQSVLMDLEGEVAKAQTLLQTHSPSSVVASLGLAVFCVCVDHLLLLSLVQQHAWLRAAVDNGAHGAIGLWSWAIVVGLRTWSGVWESVLAGCLASALDLDHFYLAGSFSLKAAVNLPRRPPLHSSSLIPLLCGSLRLLVGACRLGPPWRPLPWLLFISLASHHIRDGTRRGLWVWPFGNTPPLPYWLYVALTATLPQLCSVLMGVLGTREADSRRNKAALDV